MTRTAEHAGWRSIALLVTCVVSMLHSACPIMVQVELHRLSWESARLSADGKYQEAVPLAQRALTVSEEVFGSDDVHTATLLNNLAGLYRATNQYQKALLCYERALTIYVKNRGPDDPHTAMVMDNLAGNFHDMGQYEQALPLYERALTIREKVLGSKHLETATSLNNIAGLYLDMGQYEQARPLYQRALKIREKMFGPEHLETAKSLNNLAGLYDKTSQYEQALLLYKRALAIDEKELRPDHPHTATDLNNLAGLYEKIGQPERALPLYQRALAIDEKTLGPMHSYTATSLNNLAELHRSIGQYDKALPLYTRALAIREEVLGLKHPDTAGSLNNLAGLYEKIGQPKRALPLYTRALAIREEVLGLNHPDTAGSLNNLAIYYGTMGDQERARLFLQRAFRIVLRPDAPAQLAVISSNLGSFYKKRQELGPAIFFYKLSVNASQQLRRGAKGLELVLQRSLTKKVEDNYRPLIEVLVMEGRLAEAEQVLAMLKQHEQFEFVSRDWNDDVRQTSATLSSTEQELADRLMVNAKVLVSIYVELDLVDKLKNPTAENQRKREQLRERLSLESERLDKAIKDVENQFLSRTKEQRAKELAEMSNSVGTLRDTLAGLNEATGARPAVIYFLPGEHMTTFLVTTKDGSFALQGGGGEQQLNESITQLRESIAARDPSYRDKAAKLYEALIAPVEPQLKTAQVNILMLYLVDALRYLPFAALYDTQAQQYLVEKYVLTFYTAAAQASLKEPSTRTWSAAAFGVSKAKGQFSALPGVIEELKRIVRAPQDGPSLGIMAGKRYPDELFTRQRLMDLLNGNKHYPVIHLATHFRLAPGKDGDSSLLLGDGELTLREIWTDQGIKLRGFDLITLSACETAMGSGHKGVEVEGLGVTLQHKGAKSVLATLWKVQDEGTAKFMEAFYGARGEERQTTKADALREAQLALLTGRVKANNPKLDLTHPYYWASFVLMGNWL